MAVNKVIYGENTLIDISDTTAVASDVALGKYFYALDGTKTAGTASGGGGSVTITDEANATGITCVITTSSEPTPVETWETICEVNSKTPNTDSPYNYFWLNEQDLGDVYPINGSEWKITIDTDVYRCTAANAAVGSGQAVYVTIGNPKYSGGTDNSSDAPFNFYNAGWGAWVGDTELPSIGYYVKIERLVTE